MSAAAVLATQRHQQRRRYEQIMGDRLPRVTDKEFVTELAAKLDLYNLSSQRSKEQQLAGAEKKRQLRLIAAALYDDDSSAVFASQSAKQRTCRRKHRKRKRKSTTTTTASSQEKTASQKIVAGKGATGVQGDSADEWTELWPPNPSKSLVESRREASECRRKDEEARRLELMLRRLSTGQKSERRQQLATSCATAAAVEDADDADSSSSSESCHCDDDNGDARTRVSCDMTVEQLYTRASSLRVGRRY